MCIRDRRYPRFWLGANDCRNPLVAFRQHRVALEQRGCMAIWAEPKKIHVEQWSSRVETLRTVEGFEFTFIGGGCCVRAKPFGRNGMYVRDGDRCVLQ